MTHTGAHPREYRCLFLDDDSSLLLETDLGVGVLHDRDLPAVLELLVPLNDNDIESTLLAVADGDEAAVRLFGRTLALAPIRAADVPARFKFAPRPPPPPGTATG